VLLHYINILNSDVWNVDCTCWKQLTTLGSTLLPPNDRLSPSCRGIWTHCCSSRPSRAWSTAPVSSATKLNKPIHTQTTCRLQCLKAGAHERAVRRVCTSYVRVVSTALHWDIRTKLVKCRNVVKVNWNT